MWWCIFDVPTSNDNSVDLGNILNDNSNDDDMLSVNVNVQNELDKHFGFVAAPIGSTGSAATFNYSTANMSSACNTSTDSGTSNYEVIPLDPNIVFNPFRYRCVSNKAYENKERKKDSV